MLLACWTVLIVFSNKGGFKKVLNEREKSVYHSHSKQKVKLP